MGRRNKIGDVETKAKKKKKKRKKERKEKEREKKILGSRRSFPHEPKNELSMFC